MRFEDLSKKCHQRWAIRWKLDHIPGIAEAITAMNRRHAAMQRNYVNAVMTEVRAVREEPKGSRLLLRAGLGLDDRARRDKIRSLGAVITDVWTSTQAASPRDNTQHGAALAV